MSSYVAKVTVIWLGCGGTRWWGWALLRPAPGGCAASTAEASPPSRISGGSHAVYAHFQDWRSGREKNCLTGTSFLHMQISPRSQTLCKISLIRICKGKISWRNPLMFIEIWTAGARRLPAPHYGRGRGQGGEPGPVQEEASPHRLLPQGEDQLTPEAETFRLYLRYTGV